MIDATQLKPRQTKSAGLRSYFVGIVLLGVYILTVNVARFSETRLAEHLQLPVLLIGLAGGVFTAFGLLAEVVRSFRTRRIRGVAIQFVTLLAFGAACYVGWAWREGKPVAGDELVSLLGKQRNDPDVQAAIRTLGPEFSDWNEADLRPNVKVQDPKQCVHWSGHNLMMKFDRSNVLVSVEFMGNVHLRPYDGSLPLGLLSNDSEQKVIDKLGPPDAKTDGSREDVVDWLYKTRHLLIEWDRTRFAKVCVLHTGP